MQVFKRLALVAAGSVLVAGPAWAQSGVGTAPGALPAQQSLESTPGTSGSVLQPADPNVPPSTNQSTPSTPNTGIGGLATGGLPGTLGSTVGAGSLGGPTGSIR